MLTCGDPQLDLDGLCRQLDLPSFSEKNSEDDDERSWTTEDHLESLISADGAAPSTSSAKEKVPNIKSPDLPKSPSPSGKQEQKCLSRVESLLKKSEVAIKLFELSLSEDHNCSCSIPYPSGHPTLSLSPLSTDGPFCFVSRHDLNLNFEYIDDEIVQWWKLDVNSILGKSFLQFYHPDDQPVFADFFAQIFENCHGVSQTYRLELNPGISQYVQTQGVIFWSNTSGEPICLLCHHILCSMPGQMERLITEPLMSRIPAFTSIFLPGGGLARSVSPDEGVATAEEGFTTAVAPKSELKEDDTSAKMCAAVLFHLGDLDEHTTGSINNGPAKYKKSPLPIISSEDMSLSLLNKKRSTSSSLKSASTGEFNIENINLDPELLDADPAWMENQCYDLVKACQSDSSISMESIKQNHSDSSMSVEENDTASIVAAANSDHAYSAKPRDINSKNQKVTASNHTSMMASFGDDKQSSSRDPFLGVAQLANTQNTESILVSLLGQGRSGRRFNNLLQSTSEKQNHVMHNSVNEEPLTTGNDLFTEGMGELFPSLAGTDNLFSNALTSGMQTSTTSTPVTDLSQNRTSLLAKFLLSKEQFNPNRGSDYLFSDDKVTERISQLQLGDETQSPMAESSKLLMQLLTGEIDGKTRVKYSMASKPHISSSIQSSVNLLPNNSTCYTNDIFGDSFSEIDFLNTPNVPLEQISNNLLEVNSTKR